MTHTITAGGRAFTVRRAREGDVPGIVAMLRDDVLGVGREAADLAPYERAFRVIDRDPAHFLAVLEDADGALAGTMQLTLLPGLARGAATRLQIEAVRVARAARGSGLGHAMFRWAEEYAVRHGATLLQLTTDNERADAHRFYEDLGYVASHVGYKKTLT